MHSSVLGAEEMEPNICSIEFLTKIYFLNDVMLEIEMLLEWKTTSFNASLNANPNDRI